MIALGRGLVLIMISATRVLTGFTKKKFLFIHFFIVKSFRYFNYFVSINVTCANDDAKSPIKLHLQLGGKIN